METEVKSRISFLVPAHHAAHCLTHTIGEIHRFANENFPDRFEIIVVPNGSPREIAYRDTRRIAQDLALLYPEVKVVSDEGKAPGKGAALQTGFSASSGDWIFTTDADLPYDLGFFTRAGTLLERGYDFVLGNRRLPQSRFTVSGSILPLVYKRHRLGLAFNWLVRALFHIRTRDTQAGIKAMSRAFAEKAFAQQTCPGFFFDIEHILVADQNGFRKTELPVHLHLRDEKSTIRLFRDGCAAITWLARIFGRSVRGTYRSERQILRTFAEAPWRTRLFLFLRWKLTPYAEMASHLPPVGKVLDLGCGHGLLALTIGANRPHCRIVGIDHDESRVADLKRKSARFENVAFRLGDVRIAVPEEATYSGISIIDTLHYFSATDQEQILRKSYAALNDGGVLIMREVDHSGGVRALWNQTYERFATRLRFTKTESGVGVYRNPREWAELLRSIGFTVTWNRCSSFLFSDVLFVATKEKELVAEAGTFGSTLTADDWGMSPAVNRGILQLAKQGLLDRVSIMSDAPFVTFGLDELKKIAHVQLGLHFNLTYRSRFHSPLALMIRGLLSFSKGSAWKAWVRAEFRRQIFELKELGVVPKHVDGHHHAHIFPGVLKTIAPIAEELGIHQMRLPYDPALWWSAKFPLNLLSYFARPIFERYGFRHQPCFYPQAQHFRDTEKLARLLAEKANHEVILHPADESDFEEHGCPDPYVAGRVTEYQAIRKISFRPRARATAADVLPKTSPPFSR
jgi:predicted glycoside hydrolase/deacetylase ChbG (UPF0249 family)/ubiquinone/menaquinone biosynthesis C-methylase UbiE/glycosyltransferase involved in cell wall biosynthesis